MDTNQIKQFKSEIAKMVDEGTLHDAFVALRTFSEGAMTWEITTQIDRLETNYKAMLSYFAGGAPDPERDAVYASITTEIRAIADTLTRQAQMASTSTLYFSTARSLVARPMRSVSSQVSDLYNEIQRLRTDLHSIADSNRTRNAESMAIGIFNTLWVSHPLSTDDLSAATAFIINEDFDPAPRAMAVSALAMGAMEYYDSRRIEALLHIYMAPVSPVVALRALVGAIIVLFRYKRRRLPKRLVEVLATAKDFATWQQDMRLMAIEFMRCRDTERISHKFSTEIMPMLTKLAPEIRDRMNDGEVDIEALAEGENPAWEELLNRDGIADKLREISEIQADGGDVYMSSFGNMKHFPFFMEMANWFLPFTSNHSSVAGVGDGTMAQTLERMPMLCDSDKYSVMMALASAPAAMRDNATAAMAAHGGQMHEMLSELEKVAAATERKAIITNYLQNLYRFYNLFRRKGEFFNPFNHGLDMMAIDAVNDSFDDVETLQLIAEFDIKHKFYEEGAVALQRLDDIAEPDAARAQKIGFCLEKIGNYARAISYYDEAQLLGGGGNWLLEHIAATYRALGEPRRAITALKELSVNKPDDFHTAMVLGNTYIEARMAADAEQQFHKALYLSPESLNARRGLAWAQFLQRKFDDAMLSYDIILADDPKVEDLLNAGHTARGLGKIGAAIDLYSHVVDMNDGKIDSLRKMLQDDAHWLADAAVDTSDTRLILEAISYNKGK